MGTTIKVDSSTYKSLSKINKNISGVILKLDGINFITTQKNILVKDRPLIPSDILII